MLTTIASLPILQTPLLQEEKWLHHGFGIKDITIQQYLEAFRILNPIIPETKQNHGKEVHVLTKRCLASFGVGAPKVPGSFWLAGDAFLTSEPNVICWVRTADCVPILLADPKHRVVGAVHTGWRGTAQKVVSAAVQAMRENWQTDPRDLKAALGPAIGGHCYPVGPDVAQAFTQAGFAHKDWMEAVWHDRWYLDLAFANLELLERAGVPREQIYLSLACTACDSEKFHSYRKAGGKKGEQVSFIVIR